MSLEAAGLIRLLNAAAGPSADGRALAPHELQGADFASLLSKARAGEIASDRPVSIAKGAALNLSQEQLARLAIAADRAEAQGATRALVFIDGKAIKLDVSMREVTGEADLSKGAILTGIDAVIGMPGDPAAQDPSLLPLPKNPAGLGNASLLKLLSSRPGHAGSAA